MSATLGSYIAEKRRLALKTQAEVAAVIGKSAQTVVGIEQGKVLPRSGQDVLAIARLINAPEAEALALYLRERVDGAAVGIDIDDASALDDMAALFMRWMSRPSLVNDDVPEASPRSNKQLESMATSLRQRLDAELGIDQHGALPITEVLRSEAGRSALRRKPDVDPPVRLEVVAHSEWWAAMTVHVDGATVVRVRDDVFERAAAGSPHERFTLAHEAMHAHLHAEALQAQPGAAVFRDGFETAGETARRLGVPPFKSPEHQANVAAGALLAPRSAVEAALASVADDAADTDAADVVAGRLQISRTAARVRLSQLAFHLVRRGAEMA